MGGWSATVRGVNQIASRLSDLREDAEERLRGYPDSLFRPGVRWELGFFMLGNPSGDSGWLAEAGLSSLIPAGLTASVGAGWPTVRDVERDFAVFDRSTVAGRRMQASLHVLFIRQILNSGGPVDLIRWHLNSLLSLAPNDPMTLELEHGLRPRLQGQPGPH